ncbi:ATP-binding protein [Streptomyces sp. R21]|uniref:ATP-binding protein n=1 Tax=Streptomyces sp. R21 TaxID=3238627 RepID=A0AB39P073_9ACTN
MTFPQAPALSEELDRLMRRMRLPYMRQAAPDVLATARAQRRDPAEVLRLLIAEEVTGRDAATRRLRWHSANFPTGKTLGSWRAEDSTIPEPTQNSLTTLEWMGRAENLVIAGPSGTGKSHFTESLARAAIEKDMRVSWFTLEIASSLASPVHRVGGGRQTLHRFDHRRMQQQCGLMTASRGRVHGRCPQLLPVITLTPVHAFGLGFRQRDGDRVHPAQKVVNGRVYGAEPLTFKRHSLQLSGLLTLRGTNVPRVLRRPAVTPQLKQEAREEAEDKRDQGQQHVDHAATLPVPERCVHGPIRAGTDVLLHSVWQEARP